MSYEKGNNPCGFCEENMHEECDCEDCTCNCPYGKKKPQAKKEAK